MRETCGTETAKTAERRCGHETCPADDSRAAGSPARHRQGAMDLRHRVSGSLHQRPQETAEPAAGPQYDGIQQQAAARIQPQGDRRVQGTECGLGSLHPCLRCHRRDVPVLADGTEREKHLYGGQRPYRRLQETVGGLQRENRETGTHRPRRCRDTGHQRKGNTGHRQ